MLGDRNAASVPTVYSMRLASVEDNFCVAKRDTNRGKIGATNHMCI
jgi:hypothetical protein